MDANRELLKGNVPTLILAVLRDAALHGYGIAREIERRSANALKLKEGTLYPALYGLEKSGLIAGEWQKAVRGIDRRVYRITPAGLAELERRTRVWNTFASAIQSVLGETGHAGASPPTAGLLGAGQLP